MTSRAILSIAAVTSAVLPLAASAAPAGPWGPVKSLSLPKGLVISGMQLRSGGGAIAGGRDRLGPIVIERAARSRKFGPIIHLGRAPGSSSVVSLSEDGAAIATWKKGVRLVVAERPRGQRWGAGKQLPLRFERTSVQAVAATRATIATVRCTAGASPSCVVATAHREGARAPWKPGPRLTFSPGDVGSYDSASSAKSPAPILRTNSLGDVLVTWISSAGAVNVATLRHLATAWGSPTVYPLPPGTGQHAAVSADISEAGGMIVAWIPGPSGPNAYGVGEELRGAPGTGINVAEGTVASGFDRVGPIVLNTYSRSPGAHLDASGTAIVNWSDPASGGLFASVRTGATFGAPEFVTGVSPGGSAVGNASLAGPRIFISWSGHEGPGDSPLGVLEHDISGGKWTYSGTAPCEDFYHDPNNDGLACDRALPIATAPDGSAIVYGRGKQGLGYQDRRAG